MLFRTLFNFVFASPVTVAATAVSLTCASILVVNISSNIETTSGLESDAKKFSENNKQDYSPPVYEKSTNKHLNSESNIDSKSSYNNYSNASSKDRSKDDSHNRNTSEKYFADEVAGVPTKNNSSSLSKNGPSFFNYSNETLPISTGSTQLDSTPTDFSSAVSTPGDSTSNTNHDDEPNAPTLENNFPADLINEVKIDADETHYISCVPIKPNGPPCMCTYTIENLDGSTSRTEDNCG